MVFAPPSKALRPLLKKERSFEKIKEWGTLFGKPKSVVIDESMNQTKFIEPLPGKKEKEDMVDFEEPYDVREQKPTNLDALNDLKDPLFHQIFKNMESLGIL